MFSRFVVTLIMQCLDSQGDEKNADPISDAFSDDILIRNEI